jgi:uncharacterized protein YciI
MKFVILKTTVGTREAYQQQLATHLEYLKDLRRKQMLLSAGTFDDRAGGMMLVEATGLEEAIDVARRDPLVEAGVDTYLVRGWVPTGGDRTEGTDGDQTPSLDPSRSGPLLAPDTEEGFRVVDASSSQRHADVMTTCLPPSLIPLDDPTRADYLRRAAGRGLRKLLLLHEKQIAGQIEFCPPEASGLPVDAPGSAVVHCLWVVEAYTGLDGGRLLLASCAEASQAASLVTVAYNTKLPWMSRGFFEKQGFVVVDQVETGRFLGDTPIVAYLLWRPLSPTARPPSWDKTRFLEGVDFCPRYPWMAGKRLFWGGSFAFHGVLVKEGLRRPELLSQFPCLATQRTEKWTLVKFGVPAAALHSALDLIQTALIAEPTYYAHLSNGDQMFIIYPDRVFAVSSDRNSWAEAIRYGVERGVPEEELVFSAQLFKGERPGGDPTSGS